jgi:hypothetical protein
MQHGTGWLPISRKHCQEIVANFTIQMQLLAIAAESTNFWQAGDLIEVHDLQTGGCKRVCMTADLLLGSAWPAVADYYLTLVLLQAS